MSKVTELDVCQSQNRRAYVSLNLPNFSFRLILDPVQANASLFFQQQKLHSNTEDMAKIRISEFFRQKKCLPNCAPNIFQVRNTTQIGQISIIKLLCKI